MAAAADESAAARREDAVIFRRWQGVYSFCLERLDSLAFRSPNHFYFFNAFLFIYSDDATNTNSINSRLSRPGRLIPFQSSSDILVNHSFSVKIARYKI